MLAELMDLDRIVLSDKILAAIKLLLTIVQGWVILILGNSKGWTPVLCFPAQTQPIQLTS